jgi:hypothetical protein
VSGLWQWGLGLNGAFSIQETKPMKDFADAVQLPSGDGFIPPVTIVDAQGHVVRVVAAADFRRTHRTVAAAPYPVPAIRRPRRAKSPNS